MTRAMKSGCLLFFLSLFGFSVQKSTPTDENYVGAVVEYLANANSTINLQNYVQLIQDAAVQNADIIVFPEMTLISPDYVVLPLNGLLKDYPIPALAPTLYDEILVSISQAAMENEIYVLINVEELLDCTNGDVAGESCPERKVYIFNTNVVFDRTGAVIDRWFSEMPYLSAASIQQAYAFTMNVNFLAAGANDVNEGSAGSGIYSGKSGALVSLLTGIPTTRLLVASVPKVPGRVIGAVQGPIYNQPSDQDTLHFSADLSLPLHTTRLLNPGTRYDFALTDNDVGCVFHVKFNERNAEQKYIYRAAAFSGVRTYNPIVSGGSRICSIFACTNDTIESCGQRFPQYSPNSTAVFEALNITAAVPIPGTDEALSAKTAVYFPVTIDTTLMPLKPAHYIFEEARELLDLYIVYSFNLRNLDAELYSFGMWGREYSTDREETIDNDSTEHPPDADSCSVHRLHTILLLLFAIVALAL